MKRRNFKSQTEISREALQLQVEAFLRKGGRIQKIDISRSIDTERISPPLIELEEEGFWNETCQVELNRLQPLSIDH